MCCVQDGCVSALPAPQGHPEALSEERVRGDQPQGTSIFAPKRKSTSQPTSMTDNQNRKLPSSCMTHVLQTRELKLEVSSLKDDRLELVRTVARSAPPSTCSLAICNSPMRSLFPSRYAMACTDLQCILVPGLARSSGSSWQKRRRSSQMWSSSCLASGRRGSKNT